MYSVSKKSEEIAKDIKMAALAKVKKVSRRKSAIQKINANLRNK